MRADSRRPCKDCKVIPGEYLGTQHRLLVLDAEFKCSKWKKRRVRGPRVNWWTLTKENARLLLRSLEAGRGCRYNVGSNGRLYSKVG